jgi:hypothetical protein
MAELTDREKTELKRSLEKNRKRMRGPDYPGEVQVDSGDVMAPAIKDPQTQEKEHAMENPLQSWMASNRESPWVKMAQDPQSSKDTVLASIAEAVWAGLATDHGPGSTVNRESIKTRLEQAYQFPILVEDAMQAVEAFLNTKNVKVEG